MAFINHNNNRRERIMFGQRLRLARKRAGLSMQALAERVTPSVSAQAISKYEADKMMPSSSVLVGLGKALGVSLDFLLGGQVEALESVEWRKNSTASAQDRAMAESIVIEKLEDYLAIEDILDMHPAEDPFAVLRVDMVADEEVIDAKARDVRREWQLGIDPIQFGILLTLNIALGQQTPPVASVLVTACSIAKTDVWRTTLTNLPFIGVLVLVLLLVTYVSAVPLWLVEVFYGN